MSCSGVANTHPHVFKSARLMDTNQPLKIKRRPPHDELIGLPARSPDPVAPVVEVQVRRVTRTEARRRQLIGLEEPNHA